MRKLISCVVILAVLMVACLAGLAGDMAALQGGIIRLHVVGASDADADQAVKLRVKDAVVEYLQQELEAADQAHARQEIAQMLPQIEELANEALHDAGFGDTVTVSLGKEAFPRRDYETFSLPAGVYESLRIRIGSAEGRNWWCVVFPSLCLGAATEDLRDEAAGAGFSDSLTDTITGEGEYELRFFLLDCLGHLQNFFHGS